MRLGELGTVYRYERSGVMHGLLRVRGFTQDDAHIFCTPEQIEDEVVNCLQFAIDTLKTFGFEQYEAELSTWDGGASGKYDGTPDQWELGENALKQGRASGSTSKVKVIPDEAAFYGPKIDVKLVDAIGRKWQLSTVQFDFTLPRRFGLEYIAEDGKAHQPLMVHRALYRLDRALLRHPDRALRRRVPGVAGARAGDRAADHRPADRVCARRSRQQLDRRRVSACTLDDRSEKVNLKIREAQLQKIPYMLVVGDREAENGQVSVRNRKHGDQGVKSVDEFLASITQLIEQKTSSE